MITLEEIKQKQTELEAMIKTYEEQEEAEFPKEGDKYWYIDEWGQVLVDIVNDSSDYEIIESGNGFRTEKKAEFEKEFRKVKYEMEKCGGVFSDKLDRDERFLIKRDEGAVTIDVAVTRWTVPNMWFPDHKSAYKAIETIGTECLLKYWFCVEVEE